MLANNGDSKTNGEMVYSAVEAAVMSFKDLGIDDYFHLGCRRSIFL